MKILNILLILVSLSSFGQKYVYVSASSLNLRSESSTSSNVIDNLNRYDNLIVIDTINSEWIKVKYGQKTGFMSQNYVKSGQAKVTTITGGRTGAICKDGTRSNATGRGACSHHGGVSRWLHSERKRVEIIDN